MSGEERKPWCLCMPGIGPHDDGCPSVTPVPSEATEAGEVALADDDILALMRVLSPVVEHRRHYGLKAEDAEVYARTVLASDWLAALLDRERRAVGAKAWEEGAHAGRTYQQEIQRHAHWSHIGKALPEPILNPYRIEADR